MGLMGRGRLATPVSLPLPFLTRISLYSQGVEVEGIKSQEWTQTDGYSCAQWGSFLSEVAGVWCKGYFGTRARRPKGPLVIGYPLRRHPWDTHSQVGTRSHGPDPDLRAPPVKPSLTAPHPAALPWCSGPWRRGRAKRRRHIPDREAIGPSTSSLSVFRGHRHRPLTPWLPRIPPPTKAPAPGVADWGGSRWRRPLPHSPDPQPPPENSRSAVKRTRALARQKREKKKKKTRLSGRGKKKRVLRRGEGDRDTEESPGFNPKRRSQNGSATDLRLRMASLTH